MLIEDRQKNEKVIRIVKKCVEALNQEEELLQIFGGGRGDTGWYFLPDAVNKTF